MNDYKAECQIEDEKGTRIEIIYLRKCKNEDEAERLAKYHFINKGVSFYNAKVTQL